MTSVTPPLNEQSQDETQSSSRTPLSQFRKYGLKVTDFSDQLWCEKQMEFTLHRGKEKTEAMVQGSARHQELHEEITEIVEVKTSTREEWWGLQLFNAWACLHQLKRENICREIPVFGKVQGVWLLGIVDQLLTQDDGQTILSDTKTRRKANLPSEAQKLTTRIQLMLYKHMFDQLVTHDFPKEDYFTELRLDPDVTFSDEFLEGLREHGLPGENLGSLLESTLEEFRNASPLAKELETRYEWQTDQSYLGSDIFPYSNAWLHHQVKTGLRYWQGERDARGVPRSERWKCRFCNFQDDCPYT
ncbi:MAG: hypothetical protein EP343_33505 [Deltaproteobacteria bacterium]|nr:MAG: hypothetical protein EP343_33505 [Deltaproteobacteria bacterium]